MDGRLLRLFAVFRRRFGSKHLWFPFQGPPPLRIQDHERQVLDYEGDPESDEAYYDLQDNEVYALNLDAGVASLVVALAATGCCPVTSCSGDPGHTEEHPLVFFWANGTEAKKVQ